MRVPGLCGISQEMMNGIDKFRFSQVKPLFCHYKKWLSRGLTAIFFISQIIISDIKLSRPTLYKLTHTLHPHSVFKVVKLKIKRETIKEALKTTAQKENNSGRLAAQILAKMTHNHEIQVGSHLVKEGSVQKTIQRIKSLKNKGNIRDLKIIRYLQDQLNNPASLEIKELAGRTIIEEVIGDKHEALRLKTLQQILPLIIPKFTSDRPSEREMDLHSHTYLSDGYATPTAWILKAFEEGLTSLAITDHNFLPGYEAFKATAILNQEIDKQNKKDGKNRFHLKLIPGMEINVLQNGSEIHMLLYIPDYYVNFPHDNKVITDFMAKLKTCMELQIKRGKKIKNWINKNYPNYPLSQTDVKRVKRLNIFSSSFTDAWWEKYQENPPEIFKELKIESGKDVWYNLIIPEGLNEYSEEEKSLFPSLEEFVEFAQQTNGRIALAHPNETIKKKDGLFEEILEKLAEVTLTGKLLPQAVLGVAYFSHKLSRSPFQESVKNYISKLNQSHPLYKRFNLRLLAEGDSHGKLSLPSNPMGRFKQRKNYPQDKTAYYNEIVNVLTKPLKALSTNELVKLKSELAKWLSLTLDENLFSEKQILDPASTISLISEEELMKIIVEQLAKDEIDLDHILRLVVQFLEKSNLEEKKFHQLLSRIALTFEAITNSELAAIKTQQKASTLFSKAA
ncbi:PHP domain-containing protein [Candidatus Auribacterota bacterium]